MVYDEIYGTGSESRLPGSWVPAGRWLIYRYKLDYWDKISFYAIDLAEGQDLAENLREFSPELPIFVKRDGSYTAPAP